VDLQQELAHSSVVVTRWSRAGNAVADPGPFDAVPTIDPATATTDDPCHLEAVRAAAPLRRRPIDRALRALDVVGSGGGLVVTSPILVLAALVIRASSRGPAFYSQVRIGRDGEPFRCHKLRTMRSDAENQLARLLDRPEYVAQWRRSRKLSDDPRVTPIGRFLRSTDLDELPQLWNVLRGEMSLVGPRPVPADEAERYGPDLPRVLSVRPGMTGLWQVGGRHRVSYERRIALDVRYVEGRGIITNLRLIARTIGLILIRRNGAS